MSSLERSSEAIFPRRKFKKENVYKNLCKGLHACRPGFYSAPLSTVDLALLANM